MKVTILGSGTSTGVPQIGCTCPVCMSQDPRDKRLRASALVEVGETRILIDCGPDFRQQMMPLPFRRIDGVLVTHEHYDHVGGLDDLRPFGAMGDISIYAEHSVAESLRARMPYCFVMHTYPGIPNLVLHEVTPAQPFQIGSQTIQPLRVIHGKLPILGYRIGKMAYITDMLSMPEETLPLLQDLEVLIINALRPEPHWTHQSLPQAMEVVRRVQAKETYFIHMSHDMGLHAEVAPTLPPHVHFAYDGLEITVGE